MQTEEEAKENERSPSVALLCAGPLRKGIVYELERVLRCAMAFYAATNNKQSITESGVCKLENIVIHEDRQTSMFYKYSNLTVIIKIFFICNLCKANNTNSYIR